MERYIAIDNACAWPNLTLLPDGALAAIIFNQPTHGGWEGDVECWASEDGGRLWRRRGVVARHDPGENRMNVAAGRARDGSLVVLASGWSRRNAPGEWTSPHRGEVLPVWVCRSRDGGATWEHGGDGASFSESAARQIPFGDIVALPDGTLGASLYDWALEAGNTAHFYVSSDDGETWTLRGTVQAETANETTPVVLPDGRVLAAARTLGDGHLELYSSSDSGATWQARGPLTMGGQHPGHLLVLADGRLLLTYGIRNKGLYGVGTRLSEDQGRTWRPPAVLVDFESATDGGYPATVQMEDGALVTAYYANGAPAHHRYHMGVVRWGLEEQT